MFVHLTRDVLIALIAVLLAEAANGWTDAPTGTSAAVASRVLTSRQALWVTALGNFVGLICALIAGAAVAKTIGTGIVRPDVISVSSISVAMMTTVVWAALAAWLGLPISKTHSLLAALAGIGYAQGGLNALVPLSGDWSDSGWIAAGKGVLWAIVIGGPIAWLLGRMLIQSKLHVTISEHWWRRMQVVTVSLVSAGHGFNDGLKYVGVFTLVLYKSGMIPEFVVLPEVILVCAFVMGLGTLVGGWRIHHRLDGMVNTHHELSKPKRAFMPFMGVCTEIVSAFAIWGSGAVGIPMSTNHAVVAAMAGAKSSQGKVHINSFVKILGGWVLTYIVCFYLAEFGTWLFG